MREGEGKKERKKNERDMGLPCVDVPGSDCLWESQRSIDDVRGEHPEAGGNIATSWILAAERGNEHGGIAGRVLLIVDTAHRENSRLVLAQLGLNFSVKPSVGLE